MLIEALANLAAKTGAERISLEIPPASDGACTVMVVTSLGHSVQVSESEENGKLLSALAAPLVVEGHVGELDRRVLSLIDRLEDEFKVAADALPETDAQKRLRELKEAQKKEDKEASTDAKVSKDDTTEVADEDNHSDALATGEADSL